MHLKHLLAANEPIVFIDETSLRVSHTSYWQRRYHGVQGLRIQRHRQGQAPRRSNEVSDVSRSLKTGPDWILPLGVEVEIILISSRQRTPRYSLLRALFF